MSEKSLNSIIAQNISIYMLDRGLSQAEVAEKIGVSHQAVSNWVNGYKIPRTDKLDRLCVLFHCSRSDLLNEKDPESDFSFRDDEVLIMAEKLRLLSSAELASVMSLVDALLLAKGGSANDN